MFDGIAIKHTTLRVSSKDVSCETSEYPEAVLVIAMDSYSMHDTFQI